MMWNEYTQQSYSWIKWSKIKCKTDYFTKNRNGKYLNFALKDFRYQVAINRDKFSHPNHQEIEVASCPLYLMMYNIYLMAKSKWFVLLSTGRWVYILTCFLLCVWCFLYKLLKLLLSEKEENYLGVAIDIQGWQRRRRRVITSTIREVKNSAIKNDGILLLKA